jgi:hypothetical protein
MPSLSLRVRSVLLMLPPPRHPVPSPTNARTRAASEIHMRLFRTFHAALPERCLPSQARSSPRRYGGTNDNQARRAKLRRGAANMDWYRISGVYWYIYMYNDGAAPAGAGGTPAVPTLHAFFNASPGSPLPAAAASSLPWEIYDRPHTNTTLN